MEFLALYSIKDGTSFSTSLAPKVFLLPKMSNPLKDPTMYNKLIGKLNFLLHTRPDFAYLVQYLGTFYQQPYQEHFDADLHTLKYLKGTLNHGLFFNNTPNYKLNA